MTINGKAAIGSEGFDDSMMRCVTRLMGEPEVDCQERFIPTTEIGQPGRASVNATFSCNLTLCVAPIVGHLDRMRMQISNPHSNPQHAMSCTTSA